MSKGTCLGSRPAEQSHTAQSPHISFLQIVLVSWVQWFGNFVQSCRIQLASLGISWKVDNRTHTSCLNQVKMVELVYLVNVLQNRKFRRLTRLVLDSGGAQVVLIRDSKDSCDPDMVTGWSRRFSLVVLFTILELLRCVGVLRYATCTIRWTDVCLYLFK